MRKNCEDCKWYKFWDSAYGRCLRFPPQTYLYKYSWFKVGHKIAYPLVAFDNQACGEYKEIEK